MAKRYKRTGRLVPAEGLVMWLYELTASLILFSVCVFLFLGAGLRQIVVEGDSMLNTLHSGDRLVLFSHGGAPKRGDIVVIDRYVEKPLIKRVVGVAGDRVAVDAQRGCLVLNGEAQENPYTAYPTIPYDMEGEVWVPPGYVFVMGDHRDNSHDSRKEDIGLVRVEDIVGRAVIRFFPMTRMGWL